MIYTIASLVELKNHAVPGTLVVVDIDETLIAPELSSNLFTSAGAELFCLYLKGRHDAKPLFDAFVKLLSQKRLCEANVTKNTIAHLQANGVWVLGLTSRYARNAYATTQCLEHFEIDLRTNALVHDVQELGLVQGVIHCDNAPKGESLVGFLDWIKKKHHFAPSQVVFCDDRWSHCLDVQESLAIPTICYHYVHPDITRLDDVDMDRLSKAVRSKQPMTEVRNLWKQSKDEAIVVAQILRFVEAQEVVTNKHMKAALTGLFSEMDCQTTL